MVKVKLFLDFYFNTISEFLSANLWSLTETVIIFGSYGRWSDCVPSADGF